MALVAPNTVPVKKEPGLLKVKCEPQGEDGLAVVSVDVEAEAAKVLKKLKQKEYESNRKNKHRSRRLLCACIA